MMQRALTPGLDEAWLSELLAEIGPPRKTLDTRIWYGRGLLGGSCRIRIFERPRRPPVVLCSQIEAERGRCVSAVVEAVAATVVCRHRPHRLEEAEPVVWLEHYPSDPGRLRRGAGRVDVARVAFAHWRPVLGTITGWDAPQFGERSWTPLTEPDVFDLIGRDEPLECLDGC